MKIIPRYSAYVLRIVQIICFHSEIYYRVQNRILDSVIMPYDLCSCTG